MREMISHKRISLLLVLLVVSGIRCSKGPVFEITDPLTGLPPVDLTVPGGECSITKIAQKNGSSGSDNAFEIRRTATLTPQSIQSYDSLRKKLDYNIQVQSAGDTLKLSTGEFFILNATTKLVEYFYTMADLADPGSDKLVFQYQYNAGGYLVKKLQFVNGSTAASYETNYTYSGNNLLTGCTVLAGSKKDRMLVSTLEYDLATERKTWLYLFTDFFEGYHYLQAFNFGKKGNYPVKSIVTNVFDVNDGSTIDTWTTNFSGYVFSKDNFILQTTAKGDLQQGLGLLFGTTRFDYQCTK